jgi:hypothetical protein
MTPIKQKVPTMAFFASRIAPNNDPKNYFQFYSKLKYFIAFFCIFLNWTNVASGVKNDHVHM